MAESFVIQSVCSLQKLSVTLNFTFYEPAVLDGLEIEQSWDIPRISNLFTQTVDNERYSIRN